MLLGPPCLERNGALRFFSREGFRPAGHRSLCNDLTYPFVGPCKDLTYCQTGRIAGFV